MPILKLLPEWPRVSRDQIINRARILVIDDRDFAYKKLFERDGYTIQKWDDVDDLQKLETNEFDIILLDLRGVGAKESSDEGFGLLKHIREASPAQIVVAYSNSDLSLEYQSFFRDADAVLHKTKTDYVEFKRTVDELLMKRFSLGFYLDRIDAELAAHQASAPKAQKKAQIAIRSGNLGGFKKYLERHVDDKAAIDRAMAVAGIAIQIAGLWTS